MTIEERENIEHALSEMKYNQIHMAGCNGSYHGNIKHFIARHKKAITYFEKLLEDV
jgi:hypothetical protein